MPLSVSDKLGPYEILGPLGAGGMGEVYRATDTRLHRDVAVKVSAERFTERFEREARVIASLNHPNICTLFDVGPNYLVMELIEGPTLAERIALGAIPLEESLSIARQIADALEAAHEKGIVHRDLKPGNIKITPDGTVKVLDFGLAKVGGTPTAKTEDSPTISMAATQAGMILGTAAYMSPEQARGKVVDKRADIWAFGVVLYEMLTGKRLFHGDDVTDTLAAVLRQEPEWEHVPMKVRRLLRKCLQKDPKRRLRDIGDAWELLEEAPVVVPATRGGRTRLLPWSVATALGVALLGVGTLFWRATRPVEQPLIRFTDDLGAELSLASTLGPALAISPDGSRLVYVSSGERENTHLSLRLLSSPKSTVLNGTDGASAPFFSPDSRWIAFFAGQRLKKISVEGGAAVTLCDLQGNVRGGSWGEDGNIWFAYQRSPLLRVSSTGGTPQPVTTLDPQKGEVTHRFAQLLPGGEAFLFTSSKDNNVWEDATIEVQSVKSGQRKILVQGGNFGHYLLGYLIYVHGGTVFAAPMNLKRLELTGPGSPVIDDAPPHLNNGFSELDFTPSGTFAYVAGSTTTAQRALYWLDVLGNSKLLPAPPADHMAPRVSPDGTRIALEIVEGGIANLAVYEWAQNRMTRLTFLKGGLASAPVWTPDGKHLVFPTTSLDLSGPGMYWIRADGAGEPIRLLESPNPRPGSFSPDGKRLVYSHALPDFGIWTLLLDLADPERPKAGKPEPFLASKIQISNPSFSPDGRWIAYNVPEAGPNEVYVRPFPGPGGKWQVSTGGGFAPIWSRNGRELFYVGQDQRIRVAPYTAKGDAFAASQPRPWSDKATIPAGDSFDVMPDGKRLIASMPPIVAESERRTHVTFLLNFGDELRRRVQKGK